MTITTINQTLRPGFLISLKTSLRGNVTYRKEDIEADHAEDDGTRKAKWQTERTIANPDEFKRGTVARSAARRRVASVCTQSAFGMLCPEIDRAKLDLAIADARKVADEFNSTAELSRLYVYILVGKVASDDVEAIKAINSEVRDLLGDMERGIKAFDAKAIREAASKVKSMGQMLSQDAAAKIQVAVDAARYTARQIAQTGDSVGRSVDQAAINRLAEARASFLDLDEVQSVGAPQAAARTVDMGTEAA